MLPASTTGSLSSITTTSIGSSEPDPGSDRGGGGDGEATKLTTGIKDEEWWRTTLQVAVPFTIAGFGTIGAGLILGTVVVSSVFILLIYICDFNRICIYKFSSAQNKF